MPSMGGSNIIRDLFVRVSAQTDMSGIQQADSAINGLVDSIGSLVSAAALLGGTMKLMGAGGDFEKSQVAFETMLGSAQRANQLFAEMEQLTLKTPFEYKDVEQGVKMWVGMGGAIEDAIESMRMLGDVAAGTGAPLERIAYAYSQIQAAGVLRGQELLQLVNAGVPILAELSKMLYGNDQSIAKVRKEMESGAITFDLVKKAFDNMTGAGGRYYRLNEKLAETTPGIISNLKDLAFFGMRDAGKAINAAFRPMLKNLYEFGQRNKELIRQDVPKFLGTIAKGAANLIEALGGLKMVAGAAAVAIGVLGAASILNGIGRLASSIGSITKLFNMMTLKGLLIVGSFLILAGIAEDIYVFFKGGDSVLGDMIKKVKELFGIVDEKTGKKSSIMSAEGQKTAWRQSSIGQIEQQLAKTFPRPSETKEQLKTMQSAPNFLAEGMHNLASGINKLFTGQPLPTPWGTEAGTVFGLQEARQKWGQQQGIQVNGDIHLYPTNENTYNSIYNELEQSIAPATTAGQ